jgi:phytoene synthase
VESFKERFFADLECGTSQNLVLAAVVDTVTKYQIDHDLFRRFLRSMTMDFTVTEYEGFTELLDYTDGSAAVIGEMLLPIVARDRELAKPGARDLGIAFQLTNFLRDIAEDLDRGRVYIPQSDIRRFGAERSFKTRTVSDGFRQMMRFEIERTQELYERSTVGDGFLYPEAKRCIRAARQLYREILHRIELLDYDVFATRAEVPRFQKFAAVAKLATFAK